MSSLRILCLSLLASLTALSGCSSHVDPWGKDPNAVKVMVSIPPLYSFVKQVGGDHVSVISVCTNTGPHDYEPNAKDALALRNAKILFGIGLELDEKFLDSLKKNSDNHNLKYVELGEAIPKGLLLEFKKDHKETEEHKAGDEHHHGEYDPHVWLGIDTSKAMVIEIAKELTAVDAAHGEEYKKNAEAYCAKLDELQSKYKPEIEKKSNRRILPLHESLNYFGRSFGLEITEPIRIDPKDDPGGLRYKQLIELCTNKEKPIRCIATEPQYEDKAAKTIQKELKERKHDVEIFVIDPLETVDDPAKLNADWYTTMMEQNLKTVVEKLK